ncbi:hypothetical protein IPJ70_02455 [Candidatus Campbellbacteria bacterium]|nr:MAG: hypothetical protein IPJ70_02455 [Candidatus Campbellbacteria bacterium]
MSWASKKQAKYLFGTILFLVLLIGIPTFFIMYKPARCDDGIQNGNENGVDCGGSCTRVCSFQAGKPIPYWQQEFQVAPGTYTAVALVENPNDALEAVAVPYVFRLRDNRNVLVNERKGTAYLPPHTIVPIFETGIQTQERIPTITDFEFLTSPDWVHSSFIRPDVEVIDRQMSNEDTAPRLVAHIRNKTLDTFLKLPVVAIVYDDKDNAMHASRTVIEKLSGTSDAEIVFTWPQPFPSAVARIDVIPLFSSKY